MIVHMLKMQVYMLLSSLFLFYKFYFYHYNRSNVRVLFKQLEEFLLSNVAEQDLRRLTGFESPLSNDSNFDTEQTSSEEESEESEPDTPACLKKKRPKPTWFVVPELLHREMGINPSFQRRYYGSLHVVEHFELMYKLKEHEVHILCFKFGT